MAILGYAVIPTPAGSVQVPVASIGDAPGPPILRAQTARGKGQLGLVDRGDVRASGATIQTQYGKLAIAKDVRQRIDHLGSWTTSGSGSFRSLYLGRTTFNRVGAIEVAFWGSAPVFKEQGTWARLGCNSMHILFDPLECIHAHVRIRTEAGASGWQLESSNCGRHYGELPPFSPNNVSTAVNGVARLDGLPPGQYDVWVDIEAWVTQEGSGAGVDFVGIGVNRWSEIT